jgi:hypothetical protein
MPGPLPLPLGGVSGFHGGDDIGAAERAIAACLGDGVYDLRPDGDHGRFRRALAVGLALLDVGDWEIWLASLPDAGLAMLDDWEDVLGLPRAPGWWTYIERHARLRARMLEYSGNNAAILKLSLETLIGTGTVYVSETDHYPLHDERNGAVTCVVMPAAVWADQAMWAECLYLAARVEPAGGKIYLAVTHDSGSPHRHPVFRSDESLSDRDCTRPDAP